MATRMATSSLSENLFTLAVVEAMQTLYPEHLADRAWDNVGLLLGNTIDKRTRCRVLLTTDLTADVVDEAIEYDVTVVVSYHPIIFKGLKTITLQDAQQTSLIRLMQHNIAVYSPHTALDAQVGGINDWLVDKVRAAVAEMGGGVEDARVIQPIAGAGETGVGYGRSVQLAGGVDAYELARRFAQQMGGIRHVLIAAPRLSATRARPQHNVVHGVSVCAGSGADVLRDVRPGYLYITGEMSHHATLAAVAKGAWVLCVLHSNSERLFLRERLQPQLTRELTVDFAGNPYRQAAVLVSENDRDPFDIWAVDEPPPQHSSTGGNRVSV